VIAAPLIQIDHRRQFLNPGLAERVAALGPFLYALICFFRPGIRAGAAWDTCLSCSVVAAQPLVALPGVAQEAVPLVYLSWRI
jgi:hypothetical protein